MQKAIWLTSFGSGDFDGVLERAQEADASLLCIRTTSVALPNAIQKFKDHGIAVYGWRWPAVVDKTYAAPHYYALREADYVVQTLIPAGLAGYIVDPESDGPGEVDDWNSSSHAQLASDFCAAIRKAAPPGFHLGITSGCEYPSNHGQIPWQAFVGFCDALYPQTYWRSSTSGSIHGGTPASSYRLGLAAWKKIAGGKPVIAIGGEITVALPQEIKDFGALVTGNQPVAHFYADTGSTAPAVLKAIASI